MSQLPHTIHETRQLLRAGAMTSVELTEAYLERIVQMEPDIHAYLHAVSYTHLTLPTKA